MCYHKHHALFGWSIRSRLVSSLSVLFLHVRWRFWGLRPLSLPSSFFIVFHKHKLKAGRGFWFSQVAFLVFGPLTNQTKLLFIR